MWQGWLGVAVVGLLSACGEAEKQPTGSPSQTAGSSGAGLGGAANAAAGLGGSASAAGSGDSALPSEAVVGELSDAERARFCAWATERAEAYRSAWDEGRICTLNGAVGALLIGQPDAAQAAAKCAEVRDACLMDPGQIVVLGCGPLTTCKSTVAQVQTYYDVYDELDQRLTDCETLPLELFAADTVERLSVLPSCSLVGVTR